ncbi:bifunctional lysylphosphatidylglycerol synthetase/lysine--tRNA ligase LysX [Actinomycetospora chlora]|uniref:Lysine--tRNA ligase n=1 Tax=Actinomycetospora chlora TaxID=663608 RepID=A0ABP9BUD0_9PSEU
MVELTADEPPATGSRAPAPTAPHRDGPAAPPAGRSATARFADRVPDLLAGYLAFVAVFCAVTAIVPPLRAPLAWLRTAIEVVSVEAPPSLATATFLAILASALRRRMRAAWWFAVAYVVLGRVLGGVELTVDTEAEDPVTLVVGGTATWLRLAFGVLALAILLVARSRFTARTQRHSGWRALGTYLALAVAGTLLGWGLLALFPGTLQSSLDRLGWALTYVLGGLGDPGTVGVDGAGPRAITFLCGLFGALAVLAAAYVLFRPRLDRRRLDPTDEQRLRVLLDQYGDDDSLGYFATRRDKAAVFSRSAKSAVTFRVVSGVSLASGDPIGDPEAWPGAIEVWLDEARRYGWLPAVMGASERGARAYAGAGLSVVELGDEAVLDVRAFSVEGRSMRVVRQAVGRVERAGHTVRIRRHADLSPEEMKEVVERADAWRDTDAERGFSMALSRLGDPADGQCVLVECFDASGALRALLSFVPWGRHGLSLDLMRRDRTAENGLTEFMVASLAEQARTLGVDRLSLNFAMFRAAFEQGERIGAGPVVRLWRRLLVLGSRWWQLESLYRANAKYQPTWTPRYLCYRAARDLPRLGLAAAAAEGFVTTPSLRTLQRRGLAGEGGPAVVLPPPSPVEAEDPVAAQLAARHAGLPEQVRVRYAKYERMLAAGVDPYPVGHPRTAGLAEIGERFRHLDADAATGERVAVTGRVVRVRDFGGLCFAVLQEGDTQLQVMLAADRLGRDGVRDWARQVDLGDHVGVTGEVGTSRRGELSVLATAWTITAKCLRPLPDKRRGLADPEARVRQRYLDLVVNGGARRMLRQRSDAVHAVREHLSARGYLEVETPMLQPVHGGANARPFTTHINAYDMRLYLRIAPELYLKRLMVGGAEKVFELNRNFRNEGADATHNPEFTMLEAYEAYGDYDTMQTMVQDMIQQAARAALGGTVVVHEGREYDLGGTWRATTVNAAISDALGEEVTADTSIEELRRHCDRIAIPYDPDWGRGAVVLELYEHLVEDRTLEPTFYRDFPTDVSPLTRQHRDDPRLAERWDLVCFGAEIGTAYSELVDPVEQRKRLTEQSLLAAGGDAEAMELDEDFLLALEYAMPPSGGLGMGVDRMVMMLTGSTIRESVLFPIVRPGR